MSGILALVGVICAYIDYEMSYSVDGVYIRYELGVYSYILRSVVSICTLILIYRINEHYKLKRILMKLNRENKNSLK